jgi:U3 small nucleolar RNA-associated protein 14
LSFPLQSQSSGRVSNLELTARFKASLYFPFQSDRDRPIIRLFLSFQPTTDLESSVDALLKSAGLKDEDIHQTEEAMLQMNELSVEEVAGEEEEEAEEAKLGREFQFRTKGKLLLF